MKKSVFDKVAAMPQPVFESLNANAFVSLFEEDRAAALQSEDAATAFLEQATDVEALLTMSEVSLQAPLNDEGYRLMMHLSHRVFTRAGIQNIPDFIQAAETLESYYQSRLASFKRTIRERQGKLSQKEKRHVTL